jgi:hypothetical protein
MLLILRCPTRRIFKTIGHHPPDRGSQVGPQRAYPTYSFKKPLIDSPLMSIPLVFTAASRRRGNWLPSERLKLDF